MATGKNVAKRAAPKAGASRAGATRTSTKASAKGASAKGASAKGAGAKRASAKRAAPKVSPARGKTVAAYVAALGGWQRDALARVLDAMQKAAPAAPCAIKWGQPVWESNGPFAWARAFGQHVSVGFWRGAEMADPHGRLEGDGDRMRHVKFKSAAEVDPALLESYVRQALELNRTRGNPTTRRTTA